MKKKILLSLFVSLSILNLTACNSKKESSSTFTISCTNQNDEMDGVKTTNKSVYSFDEEQYVKDYEITTVSVYDDKETYDFYKKSSKDTVANNNSSLITYKVKGNDKTKTITFSYKVTLNKDDLTTSGDIESYKAINVLKRAEEADMKCKVNGIDKNKIK